MKAIVLGGGHDQVRLIQILRGRGIEIVLIDYLDNPPGKALSNKHYKTSTLDVEKVYEVAKDEGASLIASSCNDPVLPIISAVSEKLNLSTPLTYSTAKRVTNKKLMKEIFISGGILTPRYKEATPDTWKAQIKHLSFPLITKPADGTSSRGVARIYKYEDAEKLILNALAQSREGSAIIEEYIEGIELTADFYVLDRNPILLMCSELKKFSNRSGGTSFYQAICPAPISDSVAHLLIDICSKIISAFELDNTPLFIQCIVRENDIYVIEFGARIGGGQKYKFIERVTSFDIMDAYVKSLLGERPSISPKKPSYFYCTNHVYTEPGTLGQVKGASILLEESLAEYVIVHKRQGDRVGFTLDSKDRILTYLVKGNSLEDIERKLTRISRVLQVFDINGNPILKRVPSESAPIQFT